MSCKHYMWPCGCFLFFFLVFMFLGLSSLLSLFGRLFLCSLCSFLLLLTLLPFYFDSLLTCLVLFRFTSCVRLPDGLHLCLVCPLVHSSPFFSFTPCWLVSSVYFNLVTSRPAGWGLTAVKFSFTLMNKELFGYSCIWVPTQPDRWRQMMRRKVFLICPILI